MRKTHGILAFVAVVTSASAQTISQPQYDVIVDHDVAITMRDGIKLFCDIYRPAQNGVTVAGRLPVILEPTPYGKTTAESWAEETRPTHYFWHRKSRPFHIDYVFLPRGWIPSAEVTVGKYRKWRSLSDHVPLIVDVSPRL